MTILTFTSLLSPAETLPYHDITLYQLLSTMPTKIFTLRQSRVR